MLRLLRICQEGESDVYSKRRVILRASYWFFIIDCIEKEAENEVELLQIA
jgi:hypothetical protein